MDPKAKKKLLRQLPDFDLGVEFWKGIYDGCGSFETAIEPAKPLILEHS